MIKLLINLLFLIIDSSSSLNSLSYFILFITCVFLCLHVTLWRSMCEGKLLQQTDPAGINKVESESESESETVRQPLPSSHYDREDESHHSSFQMTLTSCSPNN